MKSVQLSLTVVLLVLAFGTPANTNHNWTADERLDLLRQTGVSKAFDDHLAKLKGEWLQMAESIGAQLRVGDLECYQFGCTLTTGHVSGYPNQTLLASLSLSESFLAWPGGVFRGAPQSQGGETTYRWIFYPSRVALKEASQ